MQNTNIFIDNLHENYSVKFIQQYSRSVMTVSSLFNRLACKSTGTVLYIVKKKRQNGCRCYGDTQGLSDILCNDILRYFD